MKGIGAGAGVVAVGAGGEVSPGPSVVGEAEAIAPIVFAGLVAAPAVGWLLRDHEVLGSDDPADGLTPEVLRNEVFNTAETRKSTNASTFVDNQNIAASGLENTLYSKGKLAAIESINDQDSESAVQTAAADAVADHISTVKGNLLKSWNESALELDNLTTALSDHSSASVSDVIEANFTDSGTYEGGGDLEPFEPEVYEDAVTHNLPDGTTIDVHDVGLDDNVYNPTNISNGADRWVIVSHDGSTFEYLIYSQWDSVWTTLDSAQTDAENGLSTWVSNVYGQVQSGEIDPGELLGPAELAQLTPDETEDFNQAVADLVALNVPIDFEREAEIYRSDIDATVYGQLAVTGEITIEAGDQFDPSSHEEDFYLTYDPSEGHGTWSDYQEGVDGGTVTFTSEPHAETVYVINTSAQETVEVATEDFTEDSGNWTVDITDQVETSITNIDSVEYYADTEGTNWITTRLTESFTVEGFEDPEGNSVDSVDYETPTQPEDDTNYITEEEWQDREEDYQDLIDQYEEQSNSGGGGSILPNLGTGGIVGGVASIAVVVYLAGQVLGN